MNALDRIANALEHLAWNQMSHKSGCEICQAKKKPIKKMPPSIVPDNPLLRKLEVEIRHRKMMAGPEEPVGDMFRYRELDKDNR